MQQYKKGNRIYSEVQVRANISKYLTDLPLILTPEFVLTYGFEFYTPLEPTTEELAAQAAAVAAVLANYEDTQAAREAAKTDNVVQYLRDHTAAECVAYVQANVTDLASAKDLLKKYAIVLSVLAKQNLR